MITIKQIVLSVAAFIVATDIAFAQTYALTPNDTVEINGVMEDLQTLSIQQVNNSSDNIILKWQKVSESVPQNWEAAVCDNAICYTSLIAGGTMNPVLPTEYGFVLLHITPHVNYGTAIVRYSVWDEANPAIKDTLTFILTVDGTSSVQEDNKPQIKLFPNPASDIITITNLALGSHYMVYDGNGKTVLSGNNSTGILSFPCKGFANGTYTISITHKGTATTKKFIIQH
ncbi:MAG: T9SS type A sorting domain-containing protein [Sphingobacteriales bacterium JAD_PAG50586_3]|nr:MAG: T9SS type A sorting domain-containing protein [Sphingobacteriales bacterium JAD_PAG50586_3]